MLYWNELCPDWYVVMETSTCGNTQSPVRCCHHVKEGLRSSLHKSTTEMLWSITVANTEQSWETSCYWIITTDHLWGTSCYCIITTDHLWGTSCYCIANNHWSFVRDILLLCNNYWSSVRDILLLYNNHWSSVRDICYCTIMRGIKTSQQDFAPKMQGGT